MAQARAGTEIDRVSGRMGRGQTDKVAGPRSAQGSTSSLQGRSRGDHVIDHGDAATVHVTGGEERRATVTIEQRPSCLRRPRGAGEQRPTRQAQFPGHPPG